MTDLVSAYESPARSFPVAGTRGTLNNAAPDCPQPQGQGETGDSFRAFMLWLYTPDSTKYEPFTDAEGETPQFLLPRLTGPGGGC